MLEITSKNTIFLLITIILLIYIHLFCLMNNRLIEKISVFHIENGHISVNLNVVGYNKMKTLTKFRKRSTTNDLDFYKPNKKLFAERSIHDFLALYYIKLYSHLKKFVQIVGLETLTFYPEAYIPKRKTKYKFPSSGIFLCVYN